MKRTVKDFDVSGKRVLVRVDFNVPMSKDKVGTIADNSRVKAALPTINYLLEKDAKVILLSHMGRPNGEANQTFSLKVVADELSKLLNKNVKFISSDLVVDEDVKKPFIR